MDNKVLDLNLNMTTHPATKDLVWLKEDDTIKIAVKNIVNTMYGERHYDINFGTQVNSALFENLSYFSNLIIVTEITRALNLYEPRINLITVWGDPDEDNNSYSILIKYYIKSNPNKVIELNLVLERVR